MFKFIWQKMHIFVRMYLSCRKDCFIHVFVYCYVYRHIFMHTNIFCLGILDT